MTAPTLREPITPGEVLKEDFLDPMGITKYRLCKETGLKQTQIGEIIKGKRAITDETDAALSKYFGLSRGYWRRMQVAYELRKKSHQLRKIELSSLRTTSIAASDASVKFCNSFTTPGLTTA